MAMLMEETFHRVGTLYSGAPGAPLGRGEGGRVPSGLGRGFGGNGSWKQRLSLPGAPGLWLAGKAITSNKDNPLTTQSLKKKKKKGLLF